MLKEGNFSPKNNIGVVLLSAVGQMSLYHGTKKYRRPYGKNFFYIILKFIFNFLIHIFKYK